MASIDEVHNYIRFLKLLKYAQHTVKSYSSMLKHFVNWLNAPLEHLTSERVLEYLECLSIMIQSNPDRTISKKVLVGRSDE